jgi:iron complex outermembrane receptor protein
MSRRNLAFIMWAAPLGALGVGPAALAQAQEEDDSVFETVTVTAQKREQSIYDVPVAISAFTAETIEKQGITDLTDIGKFVPNLNITGFSAGHTSSQNPFIRGIGLQDHLITTEPGVGVYVDGIYLGRQVGQNWSLANIERVEVLRGPQGTLYGRNSIGGAINIITRKPGDKPGGQVSLTAGSRGRLNGGAYVDMPLSDEFAMSFSAAYQRRDGLGDFLLIEDPNQEVGEMQDISGRIAMQWKPTDNLSFLLTGDGNDGENGLRPYYTLIDELGAACRATAGPADDCTAANGAVYNAGYRNTRADSTTTASMTTSCRSRRSAPPISSRWNCRPRVRAAASTTCSAFSTTKRKGRTSRTIRASTAARPLRRARLPTAATSSFTRSTTASRPTPMSASR